MLTMDRSGSHKGLLLPLSIIAVGIAINVVYAGAMLLLPLPEPKFNLSVESGQVDTGKFNPMNWPQSQQAAIGLMGHDTVVTSYSEEKPLPIASIAKVITALAVLNEKPLQLDQPGPTIALGADDVALYNSYRSKGGSVVKVTAGQEISQYQALQAMLIPSGNNMAASLVKWAFGSEEAYVKYANNMVAKLGLEKTHVDDASGFSAKTVSTASELVFLGRLALENPVIAQITSQSEATIPGAGRVVTTNAVLGESGIKGIKTGHTAESGGCFLFAAEREAEGLKAVVLGAVLGAPTIEDARGTAPAVVEQGFGNVAQSTGLGDLMPVGNAQVPWYEPVSVVAKKQVKQIIWRGTPLELNVSIDNSKTSGVVGKGVLGTATTELTLQKPIPEPDIWWRLTHPVDLLSGVGLFGS